MIVTHIDGRRMGVRVRGMQSRFPSARETLLRSTADIAADAFDRVSPRDTNRYVRAWIEAAGGAGSRPRVLPVLRPSHKAAYIRIRLVQQWTEAKKRAEDQKEWMDAWYPPGKKVSPFGRRQMAILAKMEKRVERLAEELAKIKGAENEPVILIGARGKNGFATVRMQVYGGIGFVDTGAGVMYMRNREPHAEIIESKFHIKRVVGATIKLVGARQISGRYATTLLGRQRGLAA